MWPLVKFGKTQVWNEKCSFCSNCICYVPKFYFFFSVIFLLVSLKFRFACFLYLVIVFLFSLFLLIRDPFNAGYMLNLSARVRLGELDRFIMFFIDLKEKNCLELEFGMWGLIISKAIKLSQYFLAAIMFWQPWCKMYANFLPNYSLICEFLIQGIFHRPTRSCCCLKSQCQIISGLPH